MFIKLLKYDFKYQIKNLVPLYIAVITLCGVCHLFDVLATQASAIFMVIHGFTLVLSIISLIGLFVWTLIVNVRYFYQNILKDEGYLTNTLPVKKSHIIISKEIMIAITFFFTILVFIIAVWIGFYYGSTKDSIDLVISTLKSGFGLGDFSTIIMTIVAMIASYFTQVQLIFLALMLGQRHNNNKVLFAIGYGFIIYTIIQFVTLGALGIGYLVDGNLADFFNSTTTMKPTIQELGQAINSIMIITLIITVLEIIIIHILTVYLFKRHLNLE